MGSFELCTAVTVRPYVVRRPLGQAAGKPPAGPPAGLRDAAKGPRTAYVV